MPEISRLWYPWSSVVLQNIVEAVPLAGYRLKLRFEDGAQGVVDVSKCVHFTGVFAPLSDPGEFAAVQVNRELGTVCWPSGSDLDPDELFLLVTGAPVPALESVKGNS
jgi:Protein of unknown function (DUF2442)